MSQEEKELLHYKDEIEKARVQLSQSEGEERALLSRLKEDHGLESAEEAEEKLVKLGEEDVLLKEKLEEKLTQIEKDYEFD